MTRNPAKLVGAGVPADSKVTEPLNATPGAVVRTTLTSSPATTSGCDAVLVPPPLGPPSARATIVYLPGVTFAIENVPSCRVMLLNPPPSITAPSPPPRPPRPPTGPSADMSITIAGPPTTTPLTVASGTICS